MGVVLIILDNLIIQEFSFSIKFGNLCHTWGLGIAIPDKQEAQTSQSFKVSSKIAWELGKTLPQIKMSNFGHSLVSEFLLSKNRI